MYRAFKGGALLVALLVALTLPAPAFAQQQSAALRVAHLSPGAPFVDVYVDGEYAGNLSGVSYGVVSPYIQLPAGTHNIQVFASGYAAVPLLDTDLTLGAGASQTLGIVGLLPDGSLDARVFDDAAILPPEGEAKIRAIHAMTDVGAAAVTTAPGGQQLILPGFSNASAYAQAPAGAYTLQLELAGTDATTLSVPGVYLAAGEVYTAFTIGSAVNGTLDIILVQDSATGMLLADTGGIPSPLVVYLGLQLLGLSAALIVLALRHNHLRAEQAKPS